MSDAESEARTFGRYLLGRDVAEEAVALYVRAAPALDRSAEPRDEAIAAYARAHPWALGALDGALALTRPRALLRRKLLLMAAILETQPRYCDEFLPRRRPPLYVFGVAASLLRGAAQTLAGFVLLQRLR